MLPGKRQIFLILLITLLSLPRISFGQTKQVHFFKYLDSNDGLSGTIIYDIVQDHMGFIWFGTDDGLNKYDGTNITVFRHDPTDSTSLPSSKIISLLVDSKGIIWIGTEMGGLVCLDPWTEKITPCKLLESYKVEYSNPSITGLQESNNKIWASIRSGGILEIPLEEGSSILHNIEIPSSPIVKPVIRSFYQSNNILWIGTYRSGLIKYDLTTKSLRTINNFKINDQDYHSINNIVPGIHPNLYIGTSENYLHVFNIETEESKNN